MEGHRLLLVHDGGALDTRKPSIARLLGSQRSMHTDRALAGDTTCSAERMRTHASLIRLCPMPAGLAQG